MEGFRIIDGVPWVGDKSYRWAAKVRYQDLNADDGTFLHRTRAFHLAFESGWVLSVTWGSYTYSSNHWADREEDWREESVTAEIAILRAEVMQEWPNGDTVSGYHTVDEVNALIAEMMEWPTLFQLADSSLVSGLCRQ